MPVDNKRTILKTALLAPGGALLSWGSQQLIAGEPYVGGVGLVVGTLFIAGFVLLNEYDVPYQGEIEVILRNELSGYSSEEIANIAQQISSNAGETVQDAVDERTGNSE